MPWFFTTIRPLKVRVVSLKAIYKILNFWSPKGNESLLFIRKCPQLKLKKKKRHFTSQMEVAIKGSWCYVWVNYRVPERAVLIDSILGRIQLAP